MRKKIFLLMAISTVCFAQEKPTEQKPVDKTEETEKEIPKAPPRRGLVPGVNVAGLTAEVGGQTAQVHGKKTFGLQEYRDVPKNGFVRRLDYLWLHDGAPLRFQFRSLDLMQRDMVFTANLEDVGRFNIQVDWMGTDRFWGNGGRSVLNEVSRGVFNTSDALRTALENATAATLPALARNAVVNSPQVEVRSNRERLTVTQTYNLKKGLDLRLNFLREHRGGHRLSSYGTFIRQGTNSGDLFEVPGTELREPTNFSITEFGAELNFARKNVVASFEYRGSLFVNNTASLTYENPFEITPMQAIPAPTLPTPSQGGQTGGGANRGRFALNQIALPPDNQAHTFTGFFMLLLPHHSKVSALVSWSRWTQDEPFLPYTVNTAITVNTPSPAPPGFPPQPTAPITTVAALPRPSLNGLINTLTHDYVATTRALRPLQLTFHYSDYDLDNKTQGIFFPGYASFGNSFWSNFLTGTPGRDNVPVISKAQGLRLQRVFAESALKPGHDWTWKAAYQFRRWHRINREASRATENGVLTSVSYAPTNSIFAQAGVGYYHLRPEPYSDPFGRELPALRMFDEARQVRKQGNALFSVAVTPKIVLSSSWLYSGAHYDTSFLGLHALVNNSVSADASLNLTENFGFFLGYGYDRSGYTYQSLTGPGVPPPDPYTRDTREHLHSGHIGFSGAFAGGRGAYELGYEAGYADTLVSTTNLSVLPANHFLNSQAFPFPRIKSQFNNLRLDTSYEVVKGVRLGLSYLFEPYRLNDFAYNTLTPYGFDSVAPDQNDTSRYYFLDVGPTNYTGNVVALYLRFSF